MQGAAFTNRLSVICGRDIQHARGNYIILWDNETLPAQRCELLSTAVRSAIIEQRIERAPTSGLPGHKGTGNDGGRRYHGHQLDHEGHAAKL